LIDEARFDIELGELELAIGPQVSSRMHRAIW